LRNILAQIVNFYNRIVSLVDTGGDLHYNVKYL
jgi:hypothetical protein